jgi:hypothetical protein
MSSKAQSSSWDSPFNVCIYNLHSWLNCGKISRAYDSMAESIATPNKIEDFNNAWPVRNTILDLWIWLPTGLHVTLPPPSTLWSYMTFMNRVIINRYEASTGMPYSNHQDYIIFKNGGKVLYKQALKRNKNGAYCQVAWKSRVFWAPNSTRLSAWCHFTGPKKLSISRAQPPPTCPCNGYARIQNIMYGLYKS